MFHNGKLLTSPTIEKQTNIHTGKKNDQKIRIVNNFPVSIDSF